MTPLIIIYINMPKYILKFPLVCRCPNCKEKYHEKRLNLTAKDHKDAMRLGELRIESFENNHMIIELWTVIEKDKQSKIDEQENN